jgi:hypothetical protein
MNVVNLTKQVKFMRLMYRNLLTWLTPWRIKWLTLIGLLILNVSDIHAEYSPQEEYEMKARFLYNVAQLVYWPTTESTQPLVFCFLGKDVFGNTLNTIKDKKVEQRQIVLKRNVTLEEIEQCQILFVGVSEQASLSNIFAKVSKKTILTVSDIASFAELGGMVHLLKEEKRIRLNVNVRVARENSVKLSSRLLTVATVVEK